MKMDKHRLTLPFGYGFFILIFALFTALTFNFSFLFLGHEWRYSQYCTSASFAWRKSVGCWQEWKKCSWSSQRKCKTWNWVVFGQSNSLSFGSFGIDSVGNWIDFAWFACFGHHNYFRIFGFNQSREVFWSIFRTKELGYCIID